ncbi:hypothetical protein ACS0TY_023813 [Phlomoides rotata]
MAPIGKESGGGVLVIPYPAQGHINPALGLAKCLASKGLLVTFLITTRVSKCAQISECNSITIHTISDGSEETLNPPETIQAYFQRLQTSLSASLAKFIDQHNTTSPSPKLIIYDSVMPWILEIAHHRGIQGAPFFTQTAAVSAVFYHLKQASLLRFPYELQDGVVSLPSLPPLETRDLPSFPALGEDSQKTVVDYMAQQFLNVDKADWIFFNTFQKLENEILGWMTNQWPIKTVGPTFLLKQNDYDNKNHTINIFEPKHEACREWLDLKQRESVVYVSLGSTASLGKEQMEELAFGLIMSNCYFLWVVRSSEVDKLPQGFTSEKGLVVEWCHQPEVLAHSALACFVTHCGWNSTLEALSYGVPIVAMAQWVDQITNSKFVEDVWRFGVRVKPGENQIISREEIAMCIKEVVHGDERVELKANACKWRDLANEAVQKGGTSADNIQDFVNKFICI